MGRVFGKKKQFLIEKNHNSTVNPSAFNYCHQSKIKMISKPSIDFLKIFNLRNYFMTLIMIEVMRRIHIDDLNIRLVVCKSLCITLPLRLAKTSTFYR